MTENRSHSLMPKPIKKPETIVNKGIESQGKSLAIEEIKLPKKQPRRSFNQEKIDHLTESIKQYGILEPLIVRRLNGHYELVAGERRYRAAIQAGFTEVPTIIRDLNDQQALEIAILENMQRDDLNPIDETEGMLELLSQSLECSQQEVIQLLNRAANAQKRNQELTNDVTRQLEIVDRLFVTVGRLNRESFRTNRLPLLNLPEDVLDVLRQGKLQYTKAKAIAQLKSESQRKQLMQQATEENLSLKALKERISFPEDVLDAVKQGQLEHVKAKVISKLKGENQRKRLIQQAIDEGLSLQVLQERVRRLYEPVADLHSEFQALSQIRSDAWKDENKKQRLESVLTELKQLLASEPKDL